MLWKPGNRGNIEDLRGRSGGRVASIGLGGVVVLIALSLLTGNDYISQFGADGGALSPQSTGTSGPVAASAQEERLADFVDAVAEDTQDAWQQILGGRYERTVVVLFRDSTDSGCGFAQAATGPFYCPSDRKVYFDLGFFDELSQRFGAPGEFAQAYVIAHEFGHHVQHLLGGDRADRQRSASGANSASVAIELQADCYAGIWGHAASKSGRFEAGHVELEPGDADQALRAAASIGDDRLQRMTTGHVAPDRFTHGTSAQRVEWFRRGMESGDPRRCETTASLTQ